MPFAVVEGEPVTELPRDLYIPPDALQVFLEAFEGPLDLLLYLIRKQNLDILDIPIAEITRQYMKYIEVMADLQLELAGEYLLMAAMLAEIKSRMLLPRPAGADGQEEDDPRAELVRRLQEYERFKKAAEDIDRLTRMERDTLPASAELVERKVVKILPQVTLQEMLVAFKDVLVARRDVRASPRQPRATVGAPAHVGHPERAARSGLHRISRSCSGAEEGRMGVTVTFIAILELMKEGLIEIVQSRSVRGRFTCARRRRHAISSWWKAARRMTPTTRTRRTKRRWRSRRSRTRTMPARRRGPASRAVSTTEDSMTRRGPTIR